MNKIQLLNPAEYEIWDSYVEKHPFGTIFHQTKWLLRLNSKKLKVFVSRHPKTFDIEGGAAIVKFSKNKLAGYNIPPYTPYHSPLFGNINNLKHFNSVTKKNEFLNALIKKIGNQFIIDFRLNSRDHTVLPYRWNGFRESLGVTYTISGTFEEYQKNIHKNKSREIGNIESLIAKNEIIVESIEDVETIIKMQEVTAKRQKFFPHKRTLKSLLSSFDSSFMKAYCLRDGQENHVISVAFFLYDNKRVYNIINGYFESNHPIAKTANLYTLHLGIKFALEKKLIFDFEGSLIPGVEKFYRLMGGSQELVCRFTKVKPFPLHIIYNTFKNLK